MDRAHSIWFDVGQFGSTTKLFAYNHAVQIYLYLFLYIFFYRLFESNWAYAVFTYICIYASHMHAFFARAKKEFSIKS